MTALLATVVVASLLGSLHCAGMCGVFVAIAVAEPGRSTSRSHLTALYNVGRLVTYVTLGTISGGIGAAVNLTGEEVGISRAAAVVTGTCMVLFGLGVLAHRRGVRFPGLPKRAHALVEAAHRRAFGLPAGRRAFVIGLMTTLLPCGWLYAFVIASAGTGSPLHGAATMGAFWIGTVPMMATLGLGIRRIAGPLARHAPVIASVSLIGIGLLTMLGRLEVRFDRTGGPALTLEEVTERVRHIGDEAPACCEAEDDESNAG